MRTITKQLAVLVILASSLIPRASWSHPLKLSASLVEYDPTDKTIRVECKVFIDDFELSLSQSVLKGVDTSTLKRESKPRIIEEYFNKFYQITLNGKRVPLKYQLATPLHRHNVLVIEFAKVPLSLKKGDKLAIRNTVMFRDFASAQTNRIIVRIPSFDIDDGHAATMHNYKFSYTLGESPQ